MANMVIRRKRTRADYRTDKFTHYDGANHRFLLEASDLGLLPGDTPDEICVISHLSGVAKRFTYYGENRDRSNDVLSWDYVDPRGSGITVRLLND